ncbi:MAG TPA: hypothetical protein VK066_18260 [Chloroflexota bacterium]|nr:hypothetical protein [Chloroflexota bacterium]
MTAPADLVVTQLSVEAGDAQESADFVTVSRPAGLWPLRRRTDQFCALLAPDRPGQGALCRQILDVMEREFAASGGRSATSALAAVLLAAHQFLRRENSMSMPEDRVRLQAAVAVLRSGGAYLGRVGLTFAAVRHRGTLQRFQGVPTENGIEVGEPRLLGGELDPQIAYSFSPFAPDDLLVLASGPQWERLRADYIEAAMDEGEPSAVASALYELGVWRQTRPTFSILVVEARVPERRAWMPRVAVPAGAHEEEEDEVEAEEYATTPARARRGSEGRRGRRGADYADLDYDDHGGYGERGAYATNGYDRAAVRGGRSRNGRRATSYDALEPRWDAPPSHPLGRTRVALERLTRVGLATGAPRALLLVVAAVALTALVFVGMAAFNTLKPPPDQASALAAQAQSYYDQVRRDPGGPGARDQLEQARQLLTQALAIRETDSWRSLLRDTQAELDRLDHVVRLPGEPPLINFADTGGDSGVTRVIVEGTDIYVLDVGGARLLRYQLQADGTLQSGEPQVLVKQGDQVGNRAVGKLIAMTWAGVGGPRTDPGLIVAESGRTFVTYNPRAGLGRIIPADSSKWQELSAMASDKGAVYLVDPKAPSVMRYPPTRSGYDSPPVAVLDSRANLGWDRLVDLQISGDSLYVLQGDGTLRKFARENGDPQAFATQPPDGLRGPIALTFGGGDNPPLYVADMGNQRIVQLAADGTYQRQFRPPFDSADFQGLRDVFLDENNRLYVLTTQGLYRYELPGE